MIVVTHLDLRTKPESDGNGDDDHEEEGCEKYVHTKKLHMDVDEVRKIVQSYFETSTGKPIDKEKIVPLSSDHAILAHKAMLRPSSRIKRTASSTVELQYREKYSMGGRAIPADAIELEGYSQILVLEQR